MLGSPNALGHVPIRPTPFSALAAAAAAWGGMPWPGARQMAPFGPPGMFPGQGFGGGHGGPGGKRCIWQIVIRVVFFKLAIFIITLFSWEFLDIKTKKK